MVWGRKDSTRPNLREWHSWFAWRPVCLEDGRWAWLCRLERKMDWGFVLGMDWCDSWYRVSISDSPESIDSDSETASRIDSSGVK